MPKKTLGRRVLLECRNPDHDTKTSPRVFRYTIPMGTNNYPQFCKICAHARYKKNQTKYDEKSRGKSDHEHARAVAAKFKLMGHTPNPHMVLAALKKLKAESDQQKKDGKTRVIIEEASVGRERMVDQAIRWAL